MILLELVLSAVPNNQITHQLTSFIKRYKNDLNLLEYHFWDEFPRRILIAELIFIYKFKDKFFPDTEAFDIKNGIVLV